METPSSSAVKELIGSDKSMIWDNLTASIEELYGDSKTDEWKAAEVNRIKNEQGIAEVDMPTLV